MLRLIIGFILLTLPGQLSAQNDQTGIEGRMISGDLTDPNGFPIAGATVEIIETKAYTLSDALGKYRLDNVPDGEFTVRVTSEDFEPVEAEGNAETTSLPVQVTEIKRNRTSIEVVASLEDLRTSIPGSLHLVSKEELTAAKPIDANEVLRRIPGVNLREDSGPAAMRLNIGMRGLNPNRSRKVLMLEDGIPIALAPYGEPDMYYSPPIERMSRVEVLKGSGQIAHGPQTVGGLVNFVTPEPPSKFHGEVDLESGQRGLFVGQASLGGSNRDQSLGWITNYLHKQGDGWRQFYYDIEDVQTKFSLRPNDRHAIALKAGLYDEVSNSTYLGLTIPMYEANPNHNPVPSDTLDVERVSGSLSHSYTISPNAVVSSAGFLYSTKRFWGRQDFDRSDNGRDYLGIAGDPSVPGERFTCATRQATGIASSTSTAPRRTTRSRTPTAISTWAFATSMRRRMTAGSTETTSTPGRASSATTSSATAGRSPATSRTAS